MSVGVPTALRVPPPPSAYPPGGRWPGHSPPGILPPPRGASVASVSTSSPTIGQYSLPSQQVGRGYAYAPQSQPLTSVIPPGGSPQALTGINPPSPGSGGSTAEPGTVPGSSTIQADVSFPSASQPPSGSYREVWADLAQLHADRAAAQLREKTAEGQEKSLRQRLEFESKQAESIVNQLVAVIQQANTRQVTSTTSLIQAASTPPPPEGEVLVGSPSSEDGCDESVAAAEENCAEMRADAEGMRVGIVEAEAELRELRGNMARTKEEVEHLQSTVDTESVRFAELKEKNGALMTAHAKHVALMESEVVELRRQVTELTVRLEEALSPLHDEEEEEEEEEQEVSGLAARDLQAPPWQGQPSPQRLRDPLPTGQPDAVYPYDPATPEMSGAITSSDDCAPSSAAPPPPAGTTVAVRRQSLRGNSRKSSVGFTELEVAVEATPRGAAAANGESSGAMAAEVDTNQANTTAEETVTTDTEDDGNLGPELEERVSRGFMQLAGCIGGSVLAKADIVRLLDMSSFTSIALFGDLEEMSDGTVGPQQWRKWLRRRGPEAACGVLDLVQDRLASAVARP